MESRHPRLPAWICLVGLTASSFVFAGDDRQVRVHLKPGRWHHVGADEVSLAAVITGVEKDLIAHLKPGSLRLLLNGHDVTRAFVGEAQRQGRITWDAQAKSLSLTVVMALPAGEYRWQASYQGIFGGGRRFEQTFFAYDRRTVAGKLGPIVQGAGPRRPKRLDLFPPYGSISPADQAFTRDARPVFRVEFGDTESGVDPRNVKILLDNRDVTAASSLGLGLATYRPNSNLGNGAHTLTAQILDRVGNLTVVNSTIIVFSGARTPWFFAPTNQPHPLAHTHHQYQNYGSSPYFHHGVDIRRPNGTKVYAARGGKVTALYWYGRQPLYFEVQITDADGFRWQYHHVDQPRVPQAIYDAFRNGTPIATGAEIGTVVTWPSSAYGMRFHHIHLNVIAPDGRYMNPLNFMLEIADATPPTVKNIYALPNASTRALNNGSSGATVSGRVDIVAEAEDLIAGQPYQLTIHRTTWEIEQISGPGHHRMPETTFWLFNYLPGGSNNRAYAHDIFKSSLYDSANRRKRTSGNYTSRVFLYTVTNRTGPSSVSDASGYWDTAAKDRFGQALWPNGQYRVTVRAYDIKGNAGSKNIIVTVQN